MRNILRLIFRGLHLMGIRPAAAVVRNFVRDTLHYLRLSYLPVWVLGLVGPWYVAAAWPAWAAIVLCGISWLVFEARLIIPATLALLIPKKIGEVPDSFKPQRIGYVLSTIGMWALVPHFAIAVTGVYRPVDLPFYGQVVFMLPFLGVVMMAIYIVATAQEWKAFWRKVLGWCVAVVFAAMLLMVAAFRFAPETTKYYVYSWHRADQRSTMKDTYENSRDRTVVIPQLKAIYNDLLTLENEKITFERGNPGIPWDRDKQAQFDSLKAQQAKLEEAPIPGAAVVDSIPDLTSPDVGVPILLAGGIIVVLIGMFKK